MTSNNETVNRQMPWAGNIAKTMTPNGKKFTVKREMWTAVARGQMWPDVAGIATRFSKFAFVLFCYITNQLMTGTVDSRETKSGSPRDQKIKFYSFLRRTRNYRIPEIEIESGLDFPI